MDDAHQQHQKHTQPDTDPERDDRTEIADHLKDALWDDACTVDEYAAQLAELVDHDADELRAHDGHMRDGGIRA